MIPTIHSIGDVFILDWETEKIKMKIDRLLERSDGTSAEVLISRAGGHLYHARVNLLSPYSKKSLAKELTKRVNSVDWETTIEQAFTKTLVEYRKGEPVITVGNLPNRVTPKYRLRPILLENQISSIYAHGGSCKSHLAILFAVMVQCDICLLGFTPLQGNVLLLDWETSEETVDEIVKAIKQGMGVESPDTPYYRRCFHLLTHDITEIQKQVLEKDIKLLIIDSAGMAAGFDKDYHSVAIEMLRAVRSLKIAVLIIDHKPKGGDTMFGSVYKFNECRAGFDIKSTQEAGSNCVDLAIFHTKYNMTAKMKPMGIHIEFEGDEDFTNAIIFSRKDVSDMPELEKGLSNKQRIINILKGGTMSYQDIAGALNLQENIVRAELSRNKKTFVRAEEGWGLLLDEIL